MKAQLISVELFLYPKNNNAQPTIKQIPPSGVIAPSTDVLVKHKT